MVLAAPMACALMADMGATVLKIEPPQGEIWRRDGPPEQFQQCAPQRRAAPAQPDAMRLSAHLRLNRGKRSIVLDTQNDPAAMTALKKLIATADVFVTNLREPALRAQGLDYDTLSKDFPALVYAHMSAWGRQGPKKDDPGCAPSLPSHPFPSD